MLIFQINYCTTLCILLVVAKSVLMASAEIICGLAESQASAVSANHLFSARSMSKTLANYKCFISNLAKRVILYGRHIE